MKYEHYFENGKRIGTWKDYFKNGRINFIQPFNNDNQYHGKIISYYENGQKSIEQVYENNRNANGLSYREWFINGDKKAELEYKDGQMISRKNWNGLGEFVNHEAYNSATNRFEKIPISSEERYDQKSSNYKNRQEEIKGWVKDKLKEKEVKKANEIKRLNKSIEGQTLNIQSRLVIIFLFIIIIICFIVKYN